MLAGGTPPRATAWCCSVRVHVFIATTAGPVRVQSVRRIEPFEDGPANASHVAVDNEGAARFSSRYRQFVDFVIGPRHRHRSFLVSVARDIEQGESWRLPLLFAHHVEATAADALAPADPVQAGDHVVLASGRVGNDLKVRSVEGMAEKFAPDVWAGVASWLTAGAQVTIAVPADNAAELGSLDAAHQRLAGGLCVIAAESAEDALVQMPFAADADAPPHGDRQPIPRARLLAVASILAVAAAAAGAWWFGANEVPQSTTPPSAETERELGSAPAPALQPRRSTLIAVRDDAGRCEPNRSGRPVGVIGERFASVHTHGLCALVLRPAAEVGAVAWLGLAPLGVPPFEQRGADWWLTPPRQGGDRQLALLLAEAPADQAALNSWLNAWLATAPRRQSAGTTLEALRRSAASAPWPLTVYGHTLQAF